MFIFQWFKSIIKSFTEFIREEYLVHFVSKSKRDVGRARSFCQFRVKTKMAQQIARPFSKELHADGKTHTGGLVQVVLYRSSTCERRDNRSGAFELKPNAQLGRSKPTTADDICRQICV